MAIKMVNSRGNVRPSFTVLRLDGLTKCRLNGFDGSEDEVGDGRVSYSAMISSVVQPDFERVSIHQVS